MESLINLIKFFIIIISIYLLYTLVGNLPEYIKDYAKGTESDEGGLNALIITFLTPLLLVINLVLIGGLVMHRRMAQVRQ